MVKNCMLWLIFSLLLTVTSATACFAINPAEEKVIKEECVIDHKFSCEHISHNTNQEPKKDSPKEESSVNKESSPSILNSNFIFYIIYKYRFMEISSNADKDVDSESEARVSSPLQNFSTRIINIVYSFFEDRY